MSKSQQLEANADKIESLTYSKAISAEELEATTQAFIQKTLEINHEEDEFDFIKEQFKGKLKPLKKESGEMLQILKVKQKTVTETVFLIANHETGIMETYNGDGELITSRRLMPEEKQLTIHPLKKAQ